MVEVLRKTLWRFGFDGQSTCHYGGEGLHRMSGLEGQLSHCRLGIIEFFVRENLTGIDSFHISSGERYGDKAGKTPRSSRQSLELCCVQEHWEEVATAVREADSIKRPVVKSKRFTKEWAEHIFERSAN